MKFDKSPLVIFILSCIPYLAVSWLYAKITEGDVWNAFIFLISVRLFFVLIEALGSFISWHFYGKQKLIKLNLEMLIKNNFPKRMYSHDDVLNYLCRIDDDDSYSVQTKMAAKNWEQMLAFYENFGIILGMRMNSAADAALDIYSPKQEAKQISF